MGDRHADAYLPTVVVLDDTGVVRGLFETDNYRVRPEPQTFLDALQTLQVKSSPQPNAVKVRW